jgi:hypothetical protein
MIKDIMEGVRMYNNIGRKEGSNEEDILESVVYKNDEMEEDEEKVYENSKMSNVKEGEEDFKIEDNKDDYKNGN